MKKISLLFLFLFISVGFSNLTFSISKGNQLQGTSIVKIYSTDKVVPAYFINPYTFDTLGVWAGTSDGDKDGSDAKFYCIDLVHVLYYWPVDPTTYTDDGNTAFKITYILNNYYPFIPFPYTGSLAAEEREAASIQMAIWHFSDGVDVTTLRDNPDIIARAQQIITDANLNAGNLVTDASLEIIPTGIESEFYVIAKDQYNNPLAGVTVNLSSTTGTLSTVSAITGFDGKTPVITVTLLPDYTAKITASANVTIHKGTIYVRSVDPDNYQKLVLATPSVLLKEVTYTFDGLLPVELSSFTSNTNGRNIQLNWETKTEKNSDKFVIERKAIGASWEAIGSVKAAVLSNSPKQYSFSDKNLQSGKYQYRLKMIDNDGSFDNSNIVETEIAIPKEFSVSQNYPNPFNPSTKIDYQVPVDAKVVMEVYNITGQKVSELVNQEQSAGYYTVDFGASKLSSGVYIYRIVANDKATGNNFSSIKKMMLLK